MKESSDLAETVSVDSSLRNFDAVNFFKHVIDVQILFASMYLFSLSGREKLYNTLVMKEIC